MFGLKEKVGGSTIGYLGYSSIIHGIAVAVVATVSQFTPLQMGTQSTTVEFEVESLPKGLQTQNLVSNKEEKAQIKAEVVVYKKKEKAVAKKAKPKKKIAKELPEKAKPSKEALEKELAAKLLVKKEAAKELSEKIAMEKLAMEKLATEKLAKEEAAKKKAEKEAADKLAKEEAAKEKTRIQKLAQQELAAQAKADKLADLPQKATKGYGVDSPQTYFNLKQVPGNVLPRYPETARRNRIQGKGELLYYVTSSGQVTKVRLVRSSGDRSLDSSAFSAISRYRYVAGQAGWTRHPFIFDLKGPAKQKPSRLRR